MELKSEHSSKGNTKSNNKTNTRQEQPTKQPNKVVKSAVILMPSPEIWKQIQDIRAKYDKSYERWMPHINLLYPFVPAEQFETVADKLRQAASQIEV
jgi:hypothetical protein